MSALQNLIFLCGPHGAGKSTLATRLATLDSRIIVPLLQTTTIKLHTTTLERITLKLCERALENYEAIELAKKQPEKIILANRCIYDARAYARAYLELGWITKQDYKNLEMLAAMVFPSVVQQPRAIILNPPFEVVSARLQDRWRVAEKKWREDDSLYLREACEGYSSLASLPGVLYLRGDEEASSLFSWIIGKPQLS